MGERKLLPCEANMIADAKSKLDEHPDLTVGVAICENAPECTAITRTDRLGCTTTAGLCKVVLERLSREA